MTAPEGSTTVPAMSPDAPTPCPYTEPAANHRNTATRASILLAFIDPPRALSRVRHAFESTIHFRPRLIPRFVELLIRFDHRSKHVKPPKRSQAPFVPEDAEELNSL